jgi:hypothetical protein
VILLATCVLRLDRRPPPREVILDGERVPLMIVRDQKLAQGVVLVPSARQDIALVVVVINNRGSVFQRPGVSDEEVV